MWVVCVLVLVVFPFLVRFASARDVLTTFFNDTALDGRQCFHARSASRIKKNLGKLVDASPACEPILHFTSESSCACALHQIHSNAQRCDDSNCPYFPRLIGKLNRRFLQQFTKEGILRGVFKQKAARAWWCRAEKAQVTVLLPGNCSFSEWTDMVDCMRHSWPKTSILAGADYSIRVLNVLDTLTYFLNSKFAIDILAGDLTFDLPRNAPVSVAYTLLDVLFVCILSHDFHSYPCLFVDGGLILSLDVKFVQPMERLSYHGECNLAY